MAAQLWCWREWSAGSEAIEAIQAATCLEYPSHANPRSRHTHTHTPEGPSLQALCRSTPINFLGIPSQLFLRPQYCPQEKSLSQMPQGFDLYTLIPLLARSVRGMEAQTITLSSTFSPSLLGAYQMISSPHLTASDRLTWGGTTCPKMHSSITTHHFPQSQSIRNGAGCVAFWD